MATTAGETALLPAMLAALRVALAIVFIGAVPLFLISTNVRWLTEDRSLYLSGFARYRVAETTGLSEPQLEQVADAFIAYFRGAPGRLDIQVEVQGSRRPLFNEREIIHMEDVQQLVRLFHTVQLASGLALVAVAVLGLLVWRQGFLDMLGWMAALGGGLTLALLVLVALLSVLDFQSLFLQFHLVSFRNDFWMLDPRRDYLIMLFPIGFWFDATIRLAMQLAAGALLLGAAGLALLRFAPLETPR